MELTERMDDLEYPPNHRFNPETLEPVDETIKRAEALKEHVPELFTVDGSLLDVGCNKGFVSFFLHDYFKSITGIDQLKDYIQLANDIKSYHKITHIDFKAMRFEELPEAHYDAIHFGQCTHYLFRDCVRAGIDPHNFLKKTKRLTPGLIVIDGAFGIIDPSPNFDCTHDKWSNEIKAMSTVGAYAWTLLPEYQLIRVVESGGSKTRKFAIFAKMN